MSILTVRNVNKRFAGLKALNEVNLDVEEGTVHAIIGPNGAGKSTLLNCFIGAWIRTPAQWTSKVCRCSA